MKKSWRLFCKTSWRGRVNTNILVLILNESNPKLSKAFMKIRISANKFPIETGRFENKNQTNRICPFCCEDTGNELYNLKGCKNKATTKTRSEFLKPFYNRWKGIQKLSQEKFKCVFFSIFFFLIRSHRLLSWKTNKKSHG